MTTIQPAAPPRRGRGLIITGTVLITLSIIGGVVGTLLLGRELDISDFDRDVAVDGARQRLVPGEIRFEVLPPLGDDPDAESGEITVGIAVDDRSVSSQQCSISDSAGEPVEWRTGRADDQLLNDPGGYEVVGTARLGSGDYVAECRSSVQEGELEAAPFDANFMVGRVIGIDDVLPIFGPLFGLLAVGGIAVLLFIVGLILLIIGLVQASRSRKSPPMPYGGPGGYGQPEYGQPQYGQPQYGQPQYGQPQYGQPQYPADEHPAWPGPHAPGPPQAQPSPPAQPPYEAPAPPHPDEWSLPHSPGSPPEQRDDPPEDHGGWTVPPSKS